MYACDIRELKMFYREKVISAAFGFIIVLWCKIVVVVKSVLYKHKS